jgi:hypothetical protein
MDEFDDKWIVYDDNGRFEKIQWKDCFVTEHPKYHQIKDKIKKFLAEKKR